MKTLQDIKTALETGKEILPGVWIVDENEILQLTEDDDDKPELGYPFYIHTSDGEILPFSSLDEIVDHINASL